MAQEYGFFDSTSYTTAESGLIIGNKAKDQSFFARYFGAFLGNGVFTEDSFSATASGGMTVSVSAGSCFINGFFAYNDEAETNTFSTDSAQHTYWCVQRCDTANGEINLTWVTDPEAGTIPVRDGEIYDLALCSVRVPEGASSITQQMITDLRADDAYCGIVKCLNVEESVANAAFVVATNRMIGGCYAASCSTAAENPAKTAFVPLSSFSLRNGVCLALLVPNGNTASNPTLNVTGGGTAYGDVPIIRASTGTANGIGSCWPDGIAYLVYVSGNFFLMNESNAYVPLTGATMTGTLKAKDNTNYETYQVRNFALSTTASKPSGNGAILGVYQ